MTAAAVPGEKAISPFIEMVFTILFGVTMLAIILGAVSPMFNRAQDTSVVNDAFQTLEVLRTAVNDVASEAQGSTRTVSLSVSSGTYRTNSTYDWLYFELDPSEPTQLSGQKGNVLVRQGLKFADWFDSYASGSGSSAVGWKNMSGAWGTSDYRYVGINGTTYHNISGSITNWKFSATISNVSGSAGGKVFVLPTNPESLIGYWTMDEGNGSVDYDYSGNRNNGTLTNMNTTGNATSGWNSTDCKSGSCLKFDGVNDYISLGNALDNDLPSTPATISVWVKGSFANGNQIVFGHYDSKIGLGFYVSGATNYFITRVGSADNTKPTFNVNSVFVNDVWNNVIVVYDINGNPNLWLNGANITTTDANNYWTWTIDEAAIGRRSTGNYFNGTIDEVMIFNRSLSTSEIAALYETSTKKISGAGGSQSIASKVANPAIVLSAPFGKTTFDNVEVTDGSQRLTFVVPLSDVDINGTLRASRGEYQLTLRNMGVNATTGRTTVQITAQ
ncbi:MAG: LamG domain-containing protein [Candidatus Aenigmarchaeota archaeon]|nr:LamG domain-containing protein [Candidatus Aenigmarchaeota archaeon]